MNIGLHTIVNGGIKRNTLGQALYDHNLHRNVQYSYFGPRVQRGTVEVKIGGVWKKTRFIAKNGWADRVEVL